MGLTENEVDIITKIADSIAKKWDVRIKYDRQCKNVKFFGPKDCLSFIIDEINETLKSAKIKLDSKYIKVCSCRDIEELN